MGTDTHEKAGEKPGTAQGSSTRKTPRPARWIVGAAALVVAAVAINSVASGAKRGADGLPPLVAMEMQNLTRLLPPASVGSAFETAEIDELVSIQEQRTEAQAKEAAFWQQGAVARWNEIARGLVAQYGMNPVNASRVFALVSVAQHDALLAVLREQRLHKRPAPARVTPLFAAKAESTYPSEHAAVAAASAAVLSFLFSSREQKDALDKRAKDHAESRVWAGVSRRSDVTAGLELGREVAARVIDLAGTDGANRAGVNWRGSIPVGKDKWKSSEHPEVVPTRPLWGSVRPWLMTRGSQFRPPPPPDVDSPEFASAIAEVREISRARTPEQLRIAKYWGDTPGTPTPPGHWNELATALVLKHGLGELATARILALMNMAVMDAGIGCWEAKYHYWYLRPTQADPTITLPVNLPNFPSYPSGHSSYSGAAAGVLGHFFPAEKAEVDAKADEASMSRVYGGIHYKFECDQGLLLGRSVAKLAIEKAASEAPVPGLSGAP
jgi:membrane-associated phospholipid phosphatase